MKIRSVLLFSGAVLLAGGYASPSAAQAESLKERQTKVSAAVTKAAPAVVAIQSRSARGFGSGSGVIVSADGLVLTAAHVVDAAGGGSEGGNVAVVLPDGREVAGKVLGRDRSRDAAMVQITEGTNWPHAELADPSSVEKGEWCIAMGHPGGFDPQRGAPVRLGRLWQADDKAFYRSDCTVSGGDSGGPLFDLDGRVIGIHSNISMDVSENRHVPVGVFRKDWDRLKKGDSWGDQGDLLSESGDRPRRRNGRRTPDLRRDDAPERNLPEPSLPAKGTVWLGVELLPGPGGVVVGQVSDNSPAAKAGLQEGDVILSIDGKAMGGTGDVINRIRESAPGDKLKFTVKRGDSEKEIAVTLAARE